MAANTSNQINVATQKITVEAEYATLISGINSELAGVDPFVLLEQSYPRAALIAEFQKRVDAAEATKAARNTLHACVAKEKDIEQEVAPLRMAMKQYLQGRYGKSSPKLQLFGFTQAKTPKKPVASKMAAVSNAKATRQARHTMGKKQKAKVKGAPAATPPSPPVVTPPPTPVTPVPASAAAPAPAPAPASPTIHNPITGASS